MLQTLFDVRPELRPLKLIYVQHGNIGHGSFEPPIASNQHRLRMRFNDLLEDLTAVYARSGIHKFAAFEKKKGWCRLYPKPRCKFQIVVDLYRSNAHAWRDLGRELGEHARQLLAGNALF